MSIVYVCSPYRGDVERNVEKAIRACKYVVSRGYLPLAPHLLFPQFMNDNIEEERELAMDFNSKLILKCDAFWVFGDIVTEGMAAEIEIASAAGMLILFQREGFLNG